MAAKSGENWNFSICIEYSATTLRVKNSVEIALSLTVSEILIFFVFRKNSRWPPKVAKIEFFQFHIEYSVTTLRVKNSVEIALSLTVSKILTFFVFPQKFKMAAKSGENWNFSILYRILSYYPTGQKFCPNRSISYGFWDIKIFSLFAKIQDGRQKWRKLKFFKILYRILFYYPVGQKFCRNRSISYGFWDISKLLKSSTENTQWST